MISKLQNKEPLKEIKKIILEIASKYGIKIDKIILFGSRARGDYKPNSDWDIIIVIQKRIDKKLEEEFWLKVNRSLVKINIIPEVLIVEKDKFNSLSKEKGYVFYYAKKEGVII